MIETRQLVKRFSGRVALAGLELTVERGEVVALLGVNGAGKTTLLRLLAGRLVPDGGSATVAGLDVVADRRALSGVVGTALSPASAWYLRLDPIANLAVFGVAQGMTQRQARDAARRQLADLGLEEHARRPVGTFSQGMRARLAIGRALLADPPVLLLDEPTAGLDLASAEALLQDLDVHRRGRAVLMATHSTAETAALADRALVLRAGHVGRALRGPMAESDVVAALQGGAACA